MLKLSDGKGFVVLNIWEKNKWLLNGSYNTKISTSKSHKYHRYSFIESWEHTIDAHLSNRENISTIDGHLSNRENISTIDADLPNRENISTIDAHLSNRENMSTIDAHLSNRENMSTIDAQLSNCENRSTIDAHLSNHENIILLGDFNSCMLDSSTRAFSETYEFRSLVKEAICFKNPEDPSCIDLILTNKHLSFQRSYAIETDWTIWILQNGTDCDEMHSPKRKPRIITYRKYKNFCNETFMTTLQHEVDKQRAFLYENGLDAFWKICTDVLEKHKLRKKHVCEQITNLSLTLKSRKPLWEVKIDSYFENKEMCVYHCYENRIKVILQF